jgi:hypothetical protein
VDTRTAEAFFRSEHRVCGLTLRPLSLRLWIRVEALVPGILEQSRNVDIYDIWIAAQILSGRQKFKPLPLRSLFWKVESELTRWIAYLHDQLSPPRYWQSSRDTPARHTPWQLATAVYVSAATATPVEQVLDMPISEVWWYQAAIAESQVPRDKPSPLITEADEDAMEQELDIEPPPPEVIEAYQQWRRSMGYEEVEL